MSDLLKRGPGKLRISKSIAIAPYVRIRWGLTTGGALVLGGKGVTYSIPLWKPKTEAEKRAAAAKAEKAKATADAARKPKPRAAAVPETEPRVRADGELSDVLVRLVSCAEFDDGADDAKNFTIEIADRAGVRRAAVVPAKTIEYITGVGSTGYFMVRARGSRTVARGIVRIELPCEDEIVRMFVSDSIVTFK